jgi:hypothetical protein
LHLAELFSKSNVDDVAIILHSLLDRTPVLLIGSDEKEIDNILNELISLFNFRNIMIFYTDFSESEDLEGLIENEEQDYGIPRNLFVCYPYTIEKAIENFTQFKFWLFGCTQNEDDRFIRAREKLFNTTPYFLKVELKDSNLVAEIEGRSFPNVDFTFEKWIYENAIKKTEISVEKMKRVISKQINIKKLDKDYYQNLMNFQQEEFDLKLNLIKKELGNFYQACRRVFGILIRIKSLQNANINSVISVKTLIDTIVYNQAPIKRIMDFIFHEWKLDLNPFLEIKRISNFTDTFESLWG